MLQKLKTFWATYRTYAILAVIAAIVAAFVLLVNGYRDARASLKAMTAIASTNSEKAQKLGDDMKAQGEVLASEREANKLAQQVFSKQLMDYMASSDASIRAIYSAMGRINAEVHQGGAVPVTPTATGGFTDVHLIQGRTGPATTEVKLDYDPAAPDATKRLVSTWTNYREDFYPTLGEWQKQDGGFVAAFHLRREVWKTGPDGHDTKVGDEVINLQDAQARYNPDTFRSNPGGYALPRWSFIGGIGHDFDTKKTVPVGILGYRMTQNIGVHGGAVGNTFLVGASWQFNFK